MSFGLIDIARRNVGVRLGRRVRTTIAAAETILTGPLSDREGHLRSLRIDAELSRREMDHVATRRSSSPSPEM